MRNRGGTWTAGALAAVAVLAGCSAPGSAGTARTATLDATAPVSDRCPEVPADARVAVLEAADGVPLAGILVGPGDAAVAVVVARGAAESVCDWLSHAQRLVEGASAQVLVLDPRGAGGRQDAADPLRDPGDVAAAATWLAQGGRPVVLIGSGDGGRAALTAAAPDGPQSAPVPAPDPAASLTPAPCGLVLLSPVTRWTSPRGRLDALATTPVPGTVWVAYEATDPAVRQDAERVLDRARRTRDVFVRDLPVVGAEHGVRLLETEPLVRGFVLRAVRRCRP